MSESSILEDELRQAIMEEPKDWKKIQALGDAIRARTTLPPT